MFFYKSNYFCSIPKSMKFLYYAVNKVNESSKDLIICSTYKEQMFPYLHK